MSLEIEPFTFDEELLRKAIEDFYLPRNLVKAICEIGQIPAHSTESHVGIGFIDIADYSYLSKFLSPKENQIVLNGLYTAFQMVLERHGGYLNKIEGDSMMFHFDGIINPQFRSYSRDEQLRRIAQELFYTCVEMQRVCSLFNQANSHFMDETASEEARKALSDAFTIINNLRSNSDTAIALQAFYQIRIRIGASLGEVTIGNFGPHGAKQWDVIGMPVINARRMETTAPIGGLRISEEFYHILEDNGVVRSYLDRFRREATIMDSVYRTIEKDELFSFREVVIKEKHNANFRTYSVQVHPGLPENISDQAETLLFHGEMGSLKILDFFQYYRGNKYIIDALEKLFEKKGIMIRKHDILGFLQPKALVELQQTHLDVSDLARVVSDRFSLYELFRLMDSFQDTVQKDILTETTKLYPDYNTAMKEISEKLKKEYELRKFALVQRTYFFDVVYPLIFLSIKHSILEYQKRDIEAVELEELT